MISSSSKSTTSLMERTPRFRSSPMATISRMTMGERDSAFSTRSWPRSMRLAISTSPSRVSSGTVPISRRYMRTGSLVFSSAPGVRSSSTSSPASMSPIELLVERAGDLGAFEHINALRADGGQQVIEVVGRMHIVRDQVVHLVIGEVALLFPTSINFLISSNLSSRAKAEFPLRGAFAEARLFACTHTAGAVLEYRHMRKLSDFSTGLGPASLAFSARTERLPYRAHQITVGQSFIYFRCSA